MMSDRNGANLLDNIICKFCCNNSRNTITCRREKRVEYTYAIEQSYRTASVVTMLIVNSSQNDYSFNREEEPEKEIEKCSLCHTHPKECACVECGAQTCKKCSKAIPSGKDISSPKDDLPAITTHNTSEICPSGKGLIDLQRNDGMSFVYLRRKPQTIL
ncbi:hypothetical protein TNIN_2781 [Trichonephila inaurata madagascariensis]|uniref:Uncharacterized protein n=1 Tax=Trichonephila inaurata madagascariensis TaxID=2747483 RepID=A0A8X7CHV5_9ARAC|nr:hypothetical protein TNIN_2781 [Trichonephila inaurata madagascariensis]